MLPPGKEPPGPEAGTSTSTEIAAVRDAAPGDHTLTAGPARAATSSHSFREGEVVAGRYLVLRFIAHGGMGEVYEADDLELRERIALKTVRPEIVSGDERALERFRREIQLARKISHPNVCRVYDVGFHAPPASGAGAEKIPFLTMELLAGETLARRIDRRIFEEAEALPIARQMAAALDAAHEAGVVHRDFKSENVFLVAGRRDGETRVVVTDFGMARAMSRERFVVTLGQRELMGTPAYMAPEQVEGGEVTGAADLYAFGIVLYEMMTGCRPFDADSPLGTAMKRLKEPPPPPRVHRPELDPRFEAAILRCLAREPAARFPSALAAVESIGGEAPPPRRTTPRAEAAVPSPKLPTPASLPAQERSEAGSLAESASQRAAIGEGARPASRLSGGVRAALALAAVAGLGAVIAFGAAYRARAKTESAASAPKPAEATPAPVPARPSVVILGFKNVSPGGKNAWIADGISEWLLTELAAGDKLRLVPNENVARVKRALKLGDAEALAPEQLPRVRENLGADYVVTGTCFPRDDEDDGSVRVDLRLQRADSGEIVLTVADEAPRPELDALASRLATRIREKLGAGTLSPAEARDVRARHAADPTADRAYVEGLVRLRVGEAEAARKLFEAALDADPRFALARAQLAEALFELGYEQQAQQASKQALDDGAELPRDERDVVEARYWEMHHDHARAIETWNRLLARHPDDTESAIRLCFVLLRANRIKEMRERLALLRPLTKDPRVDVIAGWTALKSSDYAEAFARGTAAAEQARAQGASMILADALTVRAGARLNLGDLDLAEADLNELKQLSLQYQDLRGTSSALGSLAVARAMRDDVAGARAFYLQQLAVVRQSGDRSNERGVRAHLADNALERGDLAESNAQFAEANRIEGPVFREMDIMMSESHRARIAEFGARPEEALDAWTNAAADAARRDSPVPQAFYIAHAARMRLQLGRLDEAEKRLAEALALARSSRWALACVQQARAWVLLHADRPAEAAAAAVEAATWAERLGAPDQAAEAASVRALAQLQAGALDRAVETIESVASALPRLQRLETRVQARLALARVRLAVGGQRALGPAIALATEAERIALSGGHEILRLEAKLVQGMIERRRPRGLASGHARLEEVRREATQRGLVLLAARAAKLLGEAPAPAGALPPLPVFSDDAAKGAWIQEVLKRAKELEALGPSATNEQKLRIVRPLLPPGLRGAVPGAPPPSSRIPAPSGRRPPPPAPPPSPPDPDDKDAPDPEG